MSPHVQECVKFFKVFLSMKLTNILLSAELPILTKILNALEIQHELMGVLKTQR